MDVKELAKRVRFESNNVIRVLTRDNRDILFLLSQDKTVKMISEVQLENFFELAGHCLVTKSLEDPKGKMDPLAKMVQRNR